MTDLKEDSTAEEFRKLFTEYLEESVEVAKGELAAGKDDRGAGRLTRTVAAAGTSTGLGLSGVGAYLVFWP